MTLGDYLAQYIYIIAFGGNQGEREVFARGALERLSRIGNVGRQSRWHLTTPMSSELYDTSEHGEYLNFVFEFYTDLLPAELYREISLIEDFFGHDRTRRWLPRAVDLDLLFWVDANSSKLISDASCFLTFCDQKSGLIIPHSEIWKREFLLKMIESGLGIDIKSLKLKFKAKS